MKKQFKKSKPSNEVLDAFKDINNFSKHNLIKLNQMPQIKKNVFKIKLNKR